MTNFLKYAAAVLSCVLLSACAGQVTNTMASAQGDPSLSFERVDIAGSEGVSTYDIVYRNGVAISAERTNEGSTFGQDMAQTALGAVVPTLINGAVALEMQDRAGNCGESCGTGGSGNQIQVVVDVDSVVDTNSSATTPGGACTTCGLLD